MKNTQKKELAVCGYEAVMAIARTNPGKIKRFYYAEERVNAVGEICRTLAKRKSPYNKVSDAELDVYLSVKTLEVKRYIVAVFCLNNLLPSIHELKLISLVVAMLDYS